MARAEQETKLGGPPECGVLCTAGTEGVQLGLEPGQPGACAVPGPGLLSPWAPVFLSASELAAPYFAGPVAAGPAGFR